jgi:sporulation protein YlmC with PRC-barrel domain
MHCTEVVMTHSLVPSDRVEGAPVHGQDGEKIGTIERLMLDKMSGAVAYAVVRHSGFLGTDPHHYPVPWNSLKYDVQRRCYETDLTLNELRSGPSELDGEAFDWGNRSPPYQHPNYWAV